MIALYAFATSFCALAYQQILAYTLMDTTSNFVLSQSITLGFFLTGMGIGTLRAERTGRLGWPRLLRVELMIGVLGLLCVGYARCSEILWSYLRLSVRPEWQMLPVLPYIFMIGYLTGLELPCLMAEDKHPTRVLSFNYFGAFSAAIFVPLVLLPGLDLSGSAIVLGLLNLLLAAGLVSWGELNRRGATIAALVTSVAIAWTVLSPKLRDFHLKFIYVHPVYAGLGEISNHLNLLEHVDIPVRVRTHYQWIDLLPRDFVERLGGDNPLVLLLDRHLQFSSSTFRRYHESMVRGAAGFLGRPASKILILGGGDGLLAAEIARSQAPPAQVDLVELDSAILDLCKNDPAIRRLNDDVFATAAWLKVHNGDGFQFVRRSTEVYDLILIDLPFPINYDLSLLYSKEFYTLVRRRLAPDGVMVFDFPSVEDRITPGHEILLHTLAAAGLAQPFAFGPEEMFVAAAKDGRALSLKADSFGNIHPLTQANLRSYEGQIGEILKRPAPVNSIFFPRILAGSFELF